MKQKLIDSILSYASALKDFRKGIHQNRPSENHLQIRKDGKLTRFYMTRKGERCCKYLPKSQIKLIRKLAQMDYQEDADKAARDMISALEKCARILENCSSPEDVYNNLPPPMKELVQEVPIRRIDVQAWKEKYKELPRNLPWTEKVNLRKNHPVEACDGTMVRSKSEALIIKVCIELGLEYVYEYPLKIGKIWYFPDFRILNMKTGKEIIYEHFGGIDSPEYAEKNLITKLRDYKKAGYESGDNLVYTFETHNYPLCEREVREFLTKHFLT